MLSKLMCTFYLCMIHKHHQTFNLFKLKMLCYWEKPQMRNIYWFSTNCSTEPIYISNVLPVTLCSLMKVPTWSRRDDKVEDEAEWGVCYHGSIYPAVPSVPCGWPAVLPPTSPGLLLHLAWPETCIYKYINIVCDCNEKKSSPQRSCG